MDAKPRKFCWHKWLSWSALIPTYDSGHKQQWRVCAKCNKAQKRTLGWDKQANSSDINAAIKEQANGR